MNIYYLGRLVGVLRDDGVFITHRDSKTFFRKFSGFGVSYNVLCRLRRLGCVNVRIVFFNGFREVVYRSTVDDFIRLGVVFNDGLDYQRVLPVGKFRPRVVQKKLFEVVKNDI